MRVQVLLFGPERTAAGQDRIAVEFASAPVTCAAIRARLGEQMPTLRPHLACSRFAVNGEFASDDAAVHERDEIALIGLVSGG